MLNKARPQSEPRMKGSLMVISEAEQAMTRFASAFSSNGSAGFAIRLSFATVNDSPESLHSYTIKIWTGVRGTCVKELLLKKVRDELLERTRIEICCALYKIGPRKRTCRVPSYFKSDYRIICRDAGDFKNRRSIGWIHVSLELLPIVLAISITINEIRRAVGRQAEFVCPIVGQKRCGGLEFERSNIECAATNPWVAFVVTIEA